MGDEVDLEHDQLSRMLLKIATEEVLVLYQTNNQ